MPQVIKAGCQSLRKLCMHKHQQHIKDRASKRKGMHQKQQHQ